MSAISVDVHELNNRLLKSIAVDVGVDEQEILAILHKLETVAISRAILKSTNIGRTVGSLTKHENPQIKQLSGEIVSSWKKAISASKNTAGPDDSRSQSQPSPKATGRNNGSESNTAETTASEVQTIHVEAVNGEHKSGDRQAPSPRVLEYVPRAGAETGDEKRERTRQILFKAFEAGCGESCILDAYRLSALIDQIEEEVYDYYADNKQDVQGYWTQIRTLKANLRDTRNPHFNDRIYQGLIDIKSLPLMTSQEMASEEKKRERANQLKECTEACQLDWEVRNIKRAKGQFTCGKCRSQDTSYHQMQTRSADEPMTTFVVCLNCKHRWKF